MSDRSLSNSPSLGWLTAACTFLLTGCITPRVDYGELSKPLEARPQTGATNEAQVSLLVPFSKDLGKWDWVKLVSGEWLKGEIASLSRDTLEFESDELGDFKLDWEKVVEVVTNTPYTLHLADRSTTVGVPYVNGKRVTLRTPVGDQAFNREAVMGFIRGKPTEANYWSGHLRLGATLQAGNVDSWDTSFAFGLERRTADSRVAASLDWVKGTVEQTETVDNQTVKASYDIYLTPRVYLTPIGIELFRDSIQNIGLRAAPYAGVGYYLVDEPDTEWEITGGLGYRYTEFDSVALGVDDSTETGTGVIESTYHKDITKDVEIDLTYGAEIGLRDSNDTNQHASLLLTFDFVWDLDFTLNLIWKRIGLPEADENGVTPENDDLRVELGFTWEF